MFQKAAMTLSMSRLAAFGVMVAMAVPVYAQSNETNDNSWLNRWAERVDAARASQPHFVAPLVSTHAVLVEQFRYDISSQRDASGGTTTNFGASKGLELIPTTRLEIGISPPPYVTRDLSALNGFGDVFVQVKYRVTSRVERQGDYFVGVFLAGTIPTGQPPNGSSHAVWSPTVVFAKGIAHVDVQTTLAVSLPASGVDTLGHAVTFNTAVDYQLPHKVWPMLEVNTTAWHGGVNDGRQQTFLTPGIVFGSFPVAERMRLGMGVGMQLAVSEFRQYDHRWIVSTRLSF